VYGRLVFPNLNIVLYNVFSRSSDTGPGLYGTEPTTFYLANLFLNFNYLLPLALLSLPALAVTYVYDNRRLGTTQQAVKAGDSSPYTLLILRLSPFYFWLTTMSLQAHKEERFMYPLYPLLCMNAAVTIFLIKGWIETIYVKVTASPYNVSFWLNL
jgi:alpha-1,2-mannosyltransferase